jgi:NADPH:quinone reductase-like Zn-dependent oxidoreductase
LFKFPKAPLSRGQSVFINGGSGGCGHFAVQLARAVVGESGRVVTCCSTKNVDWVKKLGADDVIDYTSVNLVEYLTQKYAAQPFDMVVDTHGSFDLYNACPKFLKENGDFMPMAFETSTEKRGYISLALNLIAAYALPAWLGGVPRRFTMSYMDPAVGGLRVIGVWVDNKQVKPRLDSVWGFDSEGVKGAYEKLMTGHAAGKVVIKVVE